MTFLEALKILDDVTALLQLNRQAHNKVMEAIQTVEAYFLQTEKKKEPLKDVSK